jgi:hypothetical protein
VAAIATAPSETTATGAHGAARLFEAGGRTLEDLVLERWDELIASGRAECPVCAPRRAATAAAPSSRSAVPRNRPTHPFGVSPALGSLSYSTTTPWRVVFSVTTRGSMNCSR